MTEKTYVCGYNHCQIHEKIPASEAVVVGNRKYHKECVEIRNKINEIKSLYIDSIDKNVLMQEIMGVLNKIIFDYGVNIDYMLFAMRHVINRKIK
jgi:hypothetical protein